MTLVSLRAIIGGMTTVPYGLAKQPLNVLLKKGRHQHVDKAMFHFVAEIDITELPTTHYTKYLKSEETAKSVRIDKRLIDDLKVKHNLLYSY